MEAENATGPGTPSMKEEEFSAAQTLGMNEEPLASREMWRKTLDSASSRLDQAISLAANSPGMTSRIENRVSILRDEIGYKRAELGI
jgi:hypothetical protein